jgi:hypothetical protein
VIGLVRYALGVAKPNQEVVNAGENGRVVAIPDHRRSKIHVCLDLTLDHITQAGQKCVTRIGDGEFVS